MTGSVSTSPTQATTTRSSSRVKSTTTAVKAGSETEDEKKVTEPALDPESGTASVLPAGKKFKVMGWDLENFGTKFQSRPQEYATAEKRIDAHWEVLPAHPFEGEYIELDYSDEHEKKLAEANKKEIEREERHREEAEYWERERIKAEGRRKHEIDLCNGWHPKGMTKMRRVGTRKREKYEDKLKAIAQHMGHDWKRTAVGWIESSDRSLLKSTCMYVWNTAMIDLTEDEYHYRIREINASAIGPIR
ncbi:hypothetical protein H310_11372 [Aphanomyces invadans]|uniref:Uncharacterized protein n=1 Tax=Aphanomyces invadans TaxID=157072 RepID=A0A024TM65_9STRA|nr:hypothetical protein H310_11372 [Aphanomyces invadans]ETV95089.1 hypothetical protein H310_11372 [Aphanomyces invadans]|eukprot:XP_008876262.1 hypothetical protein H310_11372 [Aphanomyces invadans]